MGLTHRQPSVADSTVHQVNSLGFDFLITAPSKEFFVVPSKNPYFIFPRNPILTMKGSAILKKAMPTVEMKDADFFQKLTKEEIECMIGIFQKLITKAQAE